MTLGTHIARLRGQKHWSQGDLADALEVSRQSVSKWETDSSVPDLDKLLKLSDLFGVTLDALVRGETVQEAAAPEPAESPEPPPAPLPHRHTTAGTILLCFGGAIALLPLLLGGGLAGLILCPPFFLCGILCFATRQHTGLWCGWAVYLSIDLYLRYATGLSWAAVRLTHLWTPQMNYVRLAIAWGQLLTMLVMIVLTLLAYRRLRLPPERRRLVWLTVGWAAALIVLPLVMDQVLLPLRSVHDGSASQLLFLLSVLYSYSRLSLITVLLVRSLAVLRGRNTQVPNSL